MAYVRGGVLPPSLCYSSEITAYHENSFKNHEKQPESMKNHESILEKLENQPNLVKKLNIEKHLQMIAT